jgi:uncharacterized membrane protein YfcA
VHHLPHRLAAHGYGDHVVPGLDEISGPRPAESTATATATAAASASSLTNRRLGRAQIDVAWGFSALSAPTSPLGARCGITAQRDANRSISAARRAH